MTTDRKQVLVRIEQLWQAHPDHSFCELIDRYIIPIGSMADHTSDEDVVKGVETALRKAGVQSPPRTVLAVAERHVYRAIEFCRRHRHAVTTTEASDDLAGEFERVDRLAREELLAGNWEDRPLPEDEAIRAAHPVRSGDHKTYGEAMRLVGACHSKGRLVALVNWLLTEIAK